MNLDHLLAPAAAHPGQPRTGPRHATLDPRRRSASAPTEDDDG